MEAEIGGDGKVSVEGHHVGELHGFRFSADVGAEGPDAKAVRAAAQSALAGEFEKRAERFANAPNGDLALGQDAILRWLGAPVAQLSGGDTPLRPRVVLLADEQLAGPARDKVQSRAERYVTFQVSTLLKPLADLEGASDLSGTARGIAYRLVESFGLLQRREIAEEVRSLDQEARAALRRHGVRFGAYHIFVPSLVKPAPANLLTLLWAVAKDGRDRPGYGDVTGLLATGRTSAVADTGFDPVFYALAGYRLLGRRAVRVDILERLADLIRPALAWKPSTAAKRPDGGFDGAQFVATPAMMSILGATADDMDEILRGLGYRSRGLEADVVAKTIQRFEVEAAAVAEAKAAAEAARTADAKADTSETAAAEAPEAAVSASSGEPDEAPVAASEPPADAVADESVEAQAVSETEGAVAEAEASEPAVADTLVEQGESVPEPAVEPGPAPEPVAEAPGADAGEAAPAPTTADADAEAQPPKLVQVWRPGGRHDNRREDGGQRPNGQRNNRQRHGAPMAAAAGSGEPKPNEERPAFRKRPQRFDKKEGPPGDKRPANGRPGGGGGERFRGRPDGERKNAGPKAGSGGGGNEARRFDRAPERPKKIDPDSPFAKLAALRDKLGGGK